MNEIDLTLKEVTIPKHLPLQNRCTALQRIPQPAILVMTLFVFPARAYFGGSVWQPAEAAAQPHRLHRVPAAGDGESLPANPVPWCQHEREAGFLH